MEKPPDNAPGACNLPHAQIPVGTEGPRDPATVVFLKALPLPPTHSHPSHCVTLAEVQTSLSPGHFPHLTSVW